MSVVNPFDPNMPMQPRLDSATGNDQADELLHLATKTTEEGQRVLQQSSGSFVLEQALNGAIIHAEEAIEICAQAVARAQATKSGKAPALPKEQKELCSALLGVTGALAQLQMVQAEFFMAEVGTDENGLPRLP